MAPLEVKNPRRLLALGYPDSGVLTILKDLTGSAPEPRTLPFPSVPLQTTLSPQTNSPQAPLSAKDSDLEPEKQNEDDPLQEAQPQTTTAGLSHTLSLSNKYYTASIPIWIDEIPSPSPSNTSPAVQWTNDFQLPEAAEVVRAVGAWIVCFRRRRRRPQQSQESRSVGKADNVGNVVDMGQYDEVEAEGWDADEAFQLMEAVKSAVDHWDSGLETCLLCVGMPVSSRLQDQRKASSRREEYVWLNGRRLETGEWQDMCFDLGFEYVDGGATPGMEDQGGEKEGMARLKEALEVTEWENVDGSLDLEDLDEEEGEDEVFGAFSGPNSSDQTSGQDKGFEFERQDLEKDFMDLKLSLLGDPDGETEEENDKTEAQQVDDLERIVARLGGVRDMTAHMNEKEKKRIAARAVNEIMGSL